MDIFYYSTLCKHSQRVIEFIVQHQLTGQLSCICVDKRKRDTNNNHTVVVLENGQTVMLPPNLHAIPALLCVKNNYTIISGKDAIIGYLQEKFGTQYANQVGGGRPGVSGGGGGGRPQQREPVGTVLGSLSGSANVWSEPYTNYQMSPDDLAAKSTSGNRPLYHYTSVNQEVKIETPEDTYRPDKVSSNVTIDVLQQQRNQEVPVVSVAPPTGLYGAGGAGPGGPSPGSGGSGGFMDGFIVGPGNTKPGMGGGGGGGSGGGNRPSYAGGL